MAGSSAAALGSPRTRKPVERPRGEDEVGGGPWAGPGAASSTSAPTAAATSSHARSAAPLGIGAQGGGARGVAASSPPPPGRDGDLDRRRRSRNAWRASSSRPCRSAATSSSRSCAVAAAGRAGAAGVGERVRAARSRRGGERGLEGRAGGLAVEAKTTRSSPEPASRWRRTSSTSIRAASSSGKPPTPVPKATSARLRAPSSSARASVAAVARRMIVAEVGPPSSIVAAWIDPRRRACRPAVVSTASPSPIGALARTPRCTAGPPARRDRARDAAAVRAARVLAALAIASTSSVVMSVSSDLDGGHRSTVPAWPIRKRVPRAWPRAGRLLPRLGAAGGERAASSGWAAQPRRRDRRGGVRGRPEAVAGSWSCAAAGRDEPTWSGSTSTRRSRRGWAGSRCADVARAVPRARLRAR